MTTATMSPIQTIESVYEAFSRGDIAHIVGLVAKDATWHQSSYTPWGGNYVGPEGATHFFQKLDAACQTTGFVVRDSVAAGNEVFSFGRHDCVLRSTGKPASVEFMFRWRVESGRIAAYDSYVDSGAIVAALQ
ncbi:MAG: nuclear transport factor 2 family protein [Vicinamibacterales bacterium]